MSNQTIIIILIILAVSLGILYLHKKNNTYTAETSPSTNSDLDVEYNTRQINTPINQKENNLKFTSVHDVSTDTQHIRPMRYSPMLNFLPKHFDTRVKFGVQNMMYGGKYGCISGAMDQRKCSSNWAYVVCGVVSDRLRIQSSIECNNKMILKHDNLSPDYLMSEGNQCKDLRVSSKSIPQKCNLGDKCQPGAPIFGLKFLKDVGCVSRGDEGNVSDLKVNLYKIREFYNSSYDIGGEVNHYFFPGQRPVRAETKWAYLESNKNSMREMVVRGPLIASMNIYSDFMDKFNRGGKNNEIYKQPGGAIPREGYSPPGIKFLGTLAVAILGWGEEMISGVPVPYWIVRFTFGENWNGDGCARVVRGENCCNIELSMMGCWNYDIISTREKYTPPIPSNHISKGPKMKRFYAIE